MQVLSNDDLRQLWSNSTGPCVSLYLPAHRAGAAPMDDPLRLRNLMQQAESGLEASGSGRGEIGRLLEPARKLLDDRNFWQHPEGGLAILSSPEISRLYRLCLPVPEVAVTSDRFHLRPLLAWMASNWHYYVLALSPRRARVFQANRESMVELDAANLPPRLAAALHCSVEAIPLPEYFERLDRGMADLMARNQAPVVLAAPDDLHAACREANTSAALLEDWAVGDPENLSPCEIYRAAETVAAAHFARERAVAIDQYSQLWYTGRTANCLANILPAVHDGRVQSLFVASGVQMWGSYDERSGQTVIFDEPTPQDQELLNLAAVHTLLTKGSVYTVEPWEMPGGGVVAAVFRY